MADDNAMAPPAGRNAMADNEALIRALIEDPANRQTLMQRYAPNLDWMPYMAKEYLRQALAYAPLGFGPYGRVGPPPVLPRSPYMPDPGRRYTLSENQGMSPEFLYQIMDRGKPIGEMGGSVAGHIAKIDEIGAGNGVTSGIGGVPNILGPRAMRQIREEFRRDYPNAVTFTGYRTSGARASDEVRSQAGGILQNLPKQTVDIP